MENGPADLCCGLSWLKSVAYGESGEPLVSYHLPKLRSSRVNAASVISLHDQVTFETMTSEGGLRNWSAAVVPVAPGERNR
ncbi:MULTISPECIES: hypothetical protein [unclassified Streptomyces]|uniref:hypothetical protein n=1 Tax=unclassified Streptomyces TaxID=2593676 RepID=UPI00081E9E7C|nr:MULTISPECIES: hypothetical protein [unclassified Streptomyces]MYZ34302.1 hypothetical protein [Streptomyces sp. SID4917]SCF65949.1 hypothetical protein GA0115259_100783 [Streptomyces sp. MnatMP-M17]